MRILPSSTQVGKLRKFFFLSFTVMTVDINGGSESDTIKQIATDPDPQRWQVTLRNILSPRICRNVQIFGLRPCVRCSLQAGAARSRPDEQKIFRFLQCCDSESGSVRIRSICFWDSWIWIRTISQRHGSGSGSGSGSSSKNSKKNLDSYCFVTFYDFLSVKNHINVSKVTSRKTFLN